MELDLKSITIYLSLEVDARLAKFELMDISDVCCLCQLHDEVIRFFGQIIVLHNDRATVDLT